VIAADRRDGRPGRLLAVAVDGTVRHLPRARLPSLMRRGDLVVANDAATLPASLTGVHGPSGGAVEVRLAGWAGSGRFKAILFGAGDHRTPTEHRAPPPRVTVGDHLVLGPLTAVVERLDGHSRLAVLRFEGGYRAFMAGLARHGRPIQYAHVPEPLALWDVWTALAAAPVAFEPPSAGFALRWDTLRAFRRRGVAFATLTHAAGLSSTGDPALDRRLPFDEPYRIPPGTAAMVNQAKSQGRRVIAIGTTVVRALEAAGAGGAVAAGAGMARNRIGPDTELRIVDAALTGMHAPGESHYALIGAFADALRLAGITEAAEAGDYRAHEFGDSLFIERQAAVRHGVLVAP